MHGSGLVPFAAGCTRSSHRSFPSVCLPICFAPLPIPPLTREFLNLEGTSLPRGGGPPFFSAIASQPVCGPPGSSATQLNTLGGGTPGAAGLSRRNFRSKVPKRVNSGQKYSGFQGFFRVASEICLRIPTQLDLGFSPRQFSGPGWIQPGSQLDWAPHPPGGESNFLFPASTIFQLSNPDPNSNPNLNPMVLRHSPPPPLHPSPSILRRRPSLRRGVGRRDVL